MTRIFSFGCGLVLSIFMGSNALAAHPLPDLSPGEIQEIISQVPGVRMVSVERRFVLKDTFSDNTIYEHGQFPEGATNSILGLFAYVPFEGGHPIYNCLAGSKRERFSSVDEGCEGQRKPGVRRVIGYVSSAQREGTVPIYRCLRKWNEGADHFDSLDASCEGVPETTNEGGLGFIWPIQRP